MKPPAPIPRIAFPVPVPRSVRSLWCLLSLLLFVSSGGGQVLYEEMAERKKALDERLDSLEMVKQTRKRRGEDLAGIEQSVASVKDSIAALRAEIAALTPENQVAPPLDTGSAGLLSTLGLPKPQGLFDWIIMAVGAIALVSGLVLVIGLFHSLLTRSRRRPKAVRPQRAAPPPSPPPAPRSTPPPAAPAMPRPFSPKESDTPADIDNESIESLRQRMHDDIARIRRFDESMTFETEPPPSPPPPPVEPSGEEGGDMRQKVLAAARQGLDAREISRRLHLSVDQVMLILRVAGRS